MGTPDDLALPCTPSWIFESFQQVDLSLFFPHTWFLERNGE